MNTFHVTVFGSLSFVLFGLASGTCPPIFSRLQWNARNPTSANPMMVPVPYMTIHHSATRNCSSIPVCMEIMGAMQNYHMDNNNWEDLAYSFGIGGDGHIYEGRGWNRAVQGNHPPMFNNQTFTICLIGDFTENLPPPAQLDATRRLLDCAVELNVAQTNYGLYGHRDMASTTCPGDALYHEIETWPHKLPPIQPKTL